MNTDPHLWDDLEWRGLVAHSTDPDALHASRARVLALPGLVRIVPGHGPSFAPSDTTPR